MTTIGICGLAGAGKTTVGKIIEQLRPLTIHANFAEALKQEAADAMGIKVTELEARKGEFRPLLQVWGTELRRKQDPEYWVKKLDLVHRRSPPAIDYFVVSDVRFQNECDWLWRKKGVLVRVSRLHYGLDQDGNFDWGGHHPGYGDDEDYHESEAWVGTELCRPSYELRNDRGLGELQSKIQEMLTNLDGVK